MKLTKENRHAANGIPPVLQQVVDDYPYSAYNNARRIVRSQITRIYEKFKTVTNNKKYIWLSQLLWGLDLDYTTGLDDGEGPEIRRDITDPDLEVVDSGNDDPF